MNSCLRCGGPAVYTSYSLRGGGVYLQEFQYSCQICGNIASSARTLNNARGNWNAQNCLPKWAAQWVSELSATVKELRTKLKEARRKRIPHPARKKGRR